jgi:hypothetical protein
VEDGLVLEKVVHRTSLCRERNEDVYKIERAKTVTLCSRMWTDETSLRLESMNEGSHSLPEITTT